MSRDEIFEKVKKILMLQLAVDADRINESSALTSDLGADSLDVVEISVMMEEQFGYGLSDADILKIKFVKYIAICLEEALEAKKEKVSNG